METIPTMPGIKILDEALPDVANIDSADGHIAFEGLPNTRDLGCLTTMDGHRIKSKHLLRSGALAPATQRDIKALLNEYHLVKVLDFRTEEERLKSPDPQDAFEGVPFIDIPILNTQTLGITREGGIKALLDVVKTIEKDPAAVMAEMYPSMVLDEQSKAGFSAFFDELLATEGGAILWHCSAGKDRAGLATVLLLHVFGVSSENIMADYLATNRYMDSSMQEILNSLAAYHLAGRLDASVRVLNSADERFLQAALDAIDREYGSMDTYLRDVLGVTPKRADALRAKYLVAE